MIWKSVLSSGIKNVPCMWCHQSQSDSKDAQRERESSPKSLHLLQSHWMKHYSSVFLPRCSQILLLLRSTAVEHHLHPSTAPDTHTHTVTQRHWTHSNACSKLVRLKTDCICWVDEDHNTHDSERHQTSLFYVRPLVAKQIIDCAFNNSFIIKL